MWTVVNSVGKLVEARLTSADSGEVGACLAEIAKLVAIAPRPVVGILDMSQVRVLGREDADRFVTVMRGDNPRVERTAIVVNADQLLGLQMERLVRAAALPRRQVFRLATPAVAWLAEVLSFEEVARARAFMNE
ncbi:MAG TPA: hypothetical protein VNW92_12515 [Polyangiaceae bacterium]|jgi:hypothetical protein|nr:hypothetical protein [Polyangiaceae bacterium]